MLGAIGKDQFFHIGNGIDAIPVGHQVGHRGDARSRIRGDCVFRYNAREGHHVDAQIIDVAAGPVDGVVAETGDYDIAAGATGNVVVAGAAVKGVVAAAAVDRVGVAQTVNGVGAGLAVQAVYARRSGEDIV